MGLVEISLTILSAGTPKPLRPAQAEQKLLAGFLVTKLFLKFHQAVDLLLYRLAPFSQLFELLLPFSLEQGQ